MRSRLWRITAFLTSIGYRAPGLYRLSDNLRRRGHKHLPYYVAAFNRLLTGVEIEPGAEIGEGLRVQHGHGIVIGKGVRIGERCIIHQQVTIGMSGSQDTPDWPTLGSDVTIYAGAKIFGAITIGDGAVIGANAVVLQDVPAGALAVGVPAQIKERHAVSPPRRC